MDVVAQALEKIGSRRITAVIFDFDGTLTRASGLSLLPIKKNLGCPAQTPLLEYIESLPSAQRLAAHDQLAAYEMLAAQTAEPGDGAQDLVSYIRAKGVATAILTRNHKQAVVRALENFEHLSHKDFDLILTRDELSLPKPGPEGVQQVARTLDVKVQEALVVGDYIFDMQAGRTAGALTVLLDPGSDDHLVDVACDIRIDHLQELGPLVDLLRPLPMGKFPNQWLERFFDGHDLQDPSLIVSPGVGDDTAAVDIRDDAVLVLKSDPITFATDKMGYYAVLVNANDLATAGARPRWFLATLLFPVGKSAAQILKVMQQLERVCRRWQITLCGGHTELTDAVTRPVVSGMLTGTVSRTDLIRKSQIRIGDRVFLTKSVGLEGAAIIAGTHRGQLLEAGLSETEIAQLHLLDQLLSILPEAQLAARNSGVSAMHDVTEGGLATALEELSIAGNCRLQIDMDRIPVKALVRKMALKMKLDPLGLIGSGALIVCCRSDDAPALQTAMKAADLPITEIGRVIAGPAGIEASQGADPVPWPKFEADELTRLYK